MQTNLVFIKFDRRDQNTETYVKPYNNKSHFVPQISDDIGGGGGTSLCMKNWKPM